MRVDPQHLFDTFGKFNQLSFLGVHQELPLVLDYLKRFAPDCKALESYLVVRSFLRSYAGNQTTFNSFRTHVERLLLWSQIIAKKSILDIRRVDAEMFMEFCLQPPAEWVGPVVKSRLFVWGGKTTLVR